MKFEDKEVAVLVSVIDAGVRAVGIQMFKDGSGAVLQSVLDKLQAQAEDDNAPVSQED